MCAVWHTAPSAVSAAHCTNPHRCFEPHQPDVPTHQPPLSPPNPHSQPINPPTHHDHLLGAPEVSRGEAGRKGAGDLGASPPHVADPAAVASAAGVAAAIAAEVAAAGGAAVTVVHYKADPGAGAVAAADHGAVAGAATGAAAGDKLRPIMKSPDNGITLRRKTKKIVGHQSCIHLLSTSSNLSYTQHPTPQPTFIHPIVSTQFPFSTRILLLL